MSGGEPVAVLKRRLARMPARLRDEANDALRAIGADVAEAVRRRLGSTDRRSAPGEAPRDAAGHLADAITVALDADDARVTVGVTDPVAAFLEFGTRTMAPRPFLRPAVEEARPAAAEHCRQALQRAAGDAEDGG